MTLSPFPPRSHPADLAARQAIALFALATPLAAPQGRGSSPQRLAQTLVKLGWQVDIFTARTTAAQETVSPCGPHSRIVRLGPPRPEAATPAEQAAWDWQFLQAFQQFQTKQGSQYPLLHTCDHRSGELVRPWQQERRLPWVHAYWFLDDHDRLAPETARQADRIIVPRPVADLPDLPCPPDKLEVVAWGADSEIFQRMPKAQAKAALDLEAETAVVLFAGRFTAHKGLETLCAAYQALQTRLPRPLRLLLVGGQGNEAQQALAQQLEALGLAATATIVPWVERSRLALYYAAADVVAIPSEREPFGRVAIEAMACGTPVVASDVGGLRFTVIPEETGLLVPPGDASALAEAIARILTDEVWARRLRRQAEACSQACFSDAALAIQLSDLYRRLLAEWLTQQPVQAPPLAVPWQVQLSSPLPLGKVS